VAQADAALVDGQHGARLALVRGAGDRGGDAAGLVGVDDDAVVAQLLLDQHHLLRALPPARARRLKALAGLSLGKGSAALARMLDGGGPAQSTV